MIAHDLKVMGHAKRLEILSLLRGHSLTVNQIVQMTALRQSAVSQHLAILKEYSFVTTQQQGKEVYYQLDTLHIRDLSNYLGDLVRTKSPDEPVVTDPICHMSLTPRSAPQTCKYNGVRHYFCGAGCLRTFVRQKGLS